MIGVRWRKVLRDMWLNRTRTILIVLTISVSVFAVGTIIASNLILEEQLPQQYAAIQPAHIVFTTSQFDSELIKSIKTIDGVADAEARRNISVRIKKDPYQESWRDLSLFGIADFDEMSVTKIWHVSGEWPPSQETLLMERGSMTYLNIQEGQTILVKNSKGKERTMRISGIAHDLYHMPAFLEGTVYGFVSDDTLNWLGEGPTYNEIYVRVQGDVHDSDYMHIITDEITDHLEGEKLLVYTTYRPTADSYPLDYIANTVILLLTLLGVLILLLGVFLIINSISALMTQQVRQIGVIKAVGGKTSQVAGIYLGLVGILGLIGSLLAIPFSIMGTRALVQFIAGMFNYVVDIDQYPYLVIIFQTLAGIFFPVLVALIPVLSGARRPPAQALNEYSSNQVWDGMLTLNRILMKVKGLNRIITYAIRNPFRNRNRLVISLVMLALAGGTFITVMNLRSSLVQTVDNMLSFWQYDIWLNLNHPYMVERLQSVADRVPGVDKVEGWVFELTRRIRPDGSESNPIFLFGVPPESPMLAPNILEGRWLKPDDGNAVVIGMGLLDVEPDLKLGKDVVIKINGKEKTFTIVGVIEMIGNQTVGYIAYLPYKTFTSITNQENRADISIVTTLASDKATKKAIGSALENAYKDAGINVGSSVFTEDERMEINSAFSILIVLLMVMVVLLSFVGGFGLTGTMSLNVIDRSREIGVIRAFGGSNRTVFRIVVIEGVVIGVISWIFGLLLAVPLTWLFCDLIGRSFLSMTLAYRFSMFGSLLWLVLVIILSIISSTIPARSAVQVTVREVLSYE